MYKNGWSLCRCKDQDSCISVIKKLDGFCPVIRWTALMNVILLEKPASLANPSMVIDLSASVSLTFWVMYSIRNLLMKSLNLILYALFSVKERWWRGMAGRRTVNHHHQALVKPIFIVWNAQVVQDHRTWEERSPSGEGRTNDEGCQYFQRRR